jgi:hypothetical protein
MAMAPPLREVLVTIWKMPYRDGSVKRYGGVCSIFDLLA